jgi:para-nitrobenzyl esterase
MLRLLIASGFVALARADSWVPSKIVATTAGQLQGKCYNTSDEYDGICRYTGIPFAAPPLKDLRWRPPQPIVPWQGVRQAVEFGDICLQPGAAPKFMSQIIGSEDCLFLNVWAPKKARCPAKGCAVMVWIHGGAYITGGTPEGLYDGATTVARHQDIIFVNVQYRLSVMGFAGAAELQGRDVESGSTGNYGIQDQRKALAWVQENIHLVGGAKDQVMIYGESAGAGSVSMHLTMPKSFPLYSKAGLESGAYAYWTAQPMAYAQKQYEALAAATHCGNQTDPVGCLLSVDGHLLVGAALGDYYASLFAGNTNLGGNI